MNGASSDERRFRPLLPAPADGSRATVSLAAVNPKLKQRRSKVGAACFACQKRKSKCSADRPQCAACIGRATRCEYPVASEESRSQALKRRLNELQRQSTAAEQVFEAIRSRPEVEAQEILRRIRAGVDIETVLRYIHDGDLLLQLTLMPETSYRYQLPFAAELPAFVRRPDNPYLNTLVYEGLFSPASPQQQRSALPLGAASVAHQSRYLKPYHAARMVDPNLAATTPSRWTAVSQDDRLMRELLEAYFLHEYPWRFPFHKDLFLEDMVTGQTRFCSSLLVNCVLAQASHIHHGLTHRSESWNPANLTYKFLAEARRLWELDGERQHVTTIQAAMILQCIYALDCLDTIALSFYDRALLLATKMGLFTESQAHKDPKYQKAFEFTAWSLFCHQATHCYHYFKPPMVREPPTSPLPDPFQHPEWYGETWIRYPLDQDLSPTHFPCLLKAIADFTVILNELGFQSFGGQGPPAPLSLEESQGFRRRLEIWYHALPDPLTPKKIVLPSHLKLHLRYHQFLVTIFEPLVATELDSTQPPSASIPIDQLPQSIISHSKACVETLARLYYLRHSYQFYDAWTMLFIPTLGFNAIETLASATDAATLEASRSTVILSAKALYDQGQNYHMSRLVLYLLKRKMKPEDVALLENFVGFKDEEQNILAIAKHVRSYWPVPIIKLHEDPSLTMLENLLKDYSQMDLDESDSISDDDDG